MLFADDARRILQNMPRRLPGNVRALMALNNKRSRILAMETTDWLHAVNGDPRLGRRKQDISRELFGDEAGDNGGDTGEITGANADDEPQVAAEVTISEPRSTGMPRSFLEGLSDVELNISHQISRPPTVATRWEVTGRHTGTLLGRPATGADVTVTGVTIVKFDETVDEGGTMAYAASEDWSCWDLPAVLQQIGADT